MSGTSSGDPLQAFTFSIRVDALPAVANGFFTDVSGLSVEYHSIEYKTFNRNTHRPLTQYLPGRTAYGQVTFKHGMTDSMDFMSWMSQVGEKAIGSVRSDVTIVQYDRTYTQKKIWKLRNAWPIKYTAGSFSATSSDFLIEELTLVCEEIVLG